MSEDDSSDWLTTSAPYLDKFEDNLRCPICRELLVRAPTITECGHTFCGECIMRHFNSSEMCPVCRSSIQRGKLRKNKAIGDLADLWQSGTRASLLELATKPPPRTPSILQGPNPQDPKAKEETIEIISDSESEIPAVEGPSVEIPEGFAQCPVCQKAMPIAEIQTTHITKCLNQASSATPSPVDATSPSSGAGSSPPLKRQKRAVFGQEYPESKLTVPHFHSMTEAKLKAKAKEIGLSIRGSRQRIISRYMEWLTVWNASVGDKHPRTITALRKHMVEWDRAQDRISEGTPNLKALDAQEWSQQNSSSFADLITKARNSAKPPQPQSNE